MLSAAPRCSLLAACVHQLAWSTARQTPAALGTRRRRSRRLQLTRALSSNGFVRDLALVAVWPAPYLQGCLPALGTAGSLVTSPPKGGAPSIPSGASSPINRNIQSNLHKAARNVGSLAGGLGRPPGGCVPKGTEAAPWRCLPSLRGSNTTMGGPCYSSRVMKLRSFLGNRRT